MGKGSFGKDFEDHPYSFGASELFNIFKWAKYEIPSLLAYTMSVQMRSALFSIHCWKDEIRDLRQAVQAFNHPDASLSVLPTFVIPHIPLRFGIPFLFV